GRSPEEIGQQLLRIIEACLDGAGGADDSDSRYNVPRRFVDALRGELLIELAGERESSGAVIGIVGNGDATRTPALPFGLPIIEMLIRLEEFTRRSEQTSTGRFVSRLSGAESTNAVVELAHDIRSPLSSILFLVDTIRRGKSGPVSSVQERQLGLVYGAALGM